MTPPRGQLAAILVLAACTAGFAQAVNHLWNTPLTPPAAPAAAGGELALQLPERLGSQLPEPPSLELSHILERPLFSPTRRPPVPVPQPVAEPEPPPQIVTFVAAEPEPAAVPASDWQELKLIGVLRAGEQRRALVTTPEDPEGTWLGEGEEVFGWRIDAIAANEVELVFGEARHTLSLQVSD
jgi:general secretion pathway protein N